MLWVLSTPPCEIRLSESCETLAGAYALSFCQPVKGISQELFKFHLIKQTNKVDILARLHGSNKQTFARRISGPVASS
jgi:hypothetical protein